MSRTSISGSINSPQRATVHDSPEENDHLSPSNSVDLSALTELQQTISDQKAKITALEDDRNQAERGRRMIQEEMDALSTSLKKNSFRCELALDGQ